MVFRFLFLFILGFLSVALQMGLVATWGQPFSLINITLIVAVLLFFFLKNRRDLFFLIIWVGFLAELFSSNFFGVHLLALLLTFFIITLISSNFLTNKTLVVLLVLSFFVFIFYNLIFVFLNFLISIKYTVNVSYSFLDYLRFGLLEFLVNTPIILLMHFLIQKSSKFFRKIFIFI